MKKKRILALLLCGVLCFCSAPNVMAAEVSGEVAEENASAEDMISEKMLKSMSESLGELIAQTEARYNALSAAEKTEMDNLMLQSSEVDFETMIAIMKQDVQVATLQAIVQKVVAEGGDAIAVDRALSEHEMYIVNNVDILNRLMQEAERYVSDYYAYVKGYVNQVLGNLNVLLSRDNIFYEQAYLTEAQKYFEQVKAIKVPEDIVNNPEADQKITALLNEVFDFIAEADQHFSMYIVDQAFEAADNYADFLAQAPEELGAEEALDDGPTSLTYDEVKTSGFTQSVIEEAEIMDDLYIAEELTYEIMSNYHSMFYGCMVAVYDGVSDAILSWVEELVADAKTSGYNGPEKDAYIKALNAYNNVIANADYVNCANAAYRLKIAAAAFAESAEEYIRANIKEQMDAVWTELQEILTHEAYYTEEYIAEVEAAMDIDLDIDVMEKEEALALIAKLEAIADKKEENYGDELQNLIASVKEDAEALDKLFGALTEEQQKEEPFASAIALVDKYEALTQSEDGCYDIAALIEAQNNLTDKDGALQEAAAKAEELLAEKPPVEEPDPDPEPEPNPDPEPEPEPEPKPEPKPDPKPDPDPEEKPDPKPEKPKDEPKEEPEDETNVDKGVQTGDASNPEAAGALGVLSLAVILSILEKRKSK